MSTEPGPRMLAVVAFVTAHPGCIKAEVCRGTGASRDSIQRAIIRGLLREDRAREASPRLYPAEAGGPR